MNKTLALMGICRKAGRLQIGHDSVFESVRNGSAKMVILTSDASPRHEKELEAVKFDGKTVRLTVATADIAPAVGKSSCIFSVTDEGFAQGLDKKIHEEGIQYGS